MNFCPKIIIKDKFLGNIAVKNPTLINTGFLIIFLHMLYCLNNNIQILFSAGERKNPVNVSIDTDFLRTIEIIFKSKTSQC